MDANSKLAEAFGNKDEELLQILEALHIQYCEFFIDSRRSHSVMSAFMEPHTVTFNTEKPGFFWVRNDPNRLNVVLDDADGNAASIRYVDLINAIQTCEDIGERPAFNKQVLLDAIDAIKHDDPHQVLAQSKLIEQEVARFRKAHLARVRTKLLGIVASLSKPEKSFLQSMLKLDATCEERKVTIPKIVHDISPNADPNGGYKRVSPKLQRTSPPLVARPPGKNPEGCWLTTAGRILAEKLSRAHDRGTDR